MNSRKRITYQATGDAGLLHMTKKNTHCSCSTWYDQITTYCTTINLERVQSCRKSGNALYTVSNTPTPRESKSVRSDQDIYAIRFQDLFSICLDDTLHLSIVDVGWGAALVHLGVKHEPCYPPLFSSNSSYLSAPGTTQQISSLYRQALN